jgi:hypothetical protein
MVQMRCAYCDEPTIIAVFVPDHLAPEGTTPGLPTPMCDDLGGCISRVIDELLREDRERAGVR